MTIYQEIILDHYHHPHNYGELENPSTHISVSNSSCGDKIHLSIKIDNKTITDIAFTGTGCAIAMASSSLVTDEVKGKKISEVQTFSKDDVLRLLNIDLTPSRLRCALLPLEALSKAIQG